MIKVTDVAGNSKYINADLVERIEANPDTVLFLVNGHSWIVRESPEELLEKIVSFRRLCHQQEPSVGAQGAAASASQQI